MSDTPSTHPYEALSPDLVLDAVESSGYLSDLRILALNSYENRVYQVGMEDGPPLIAKFYRPERWSDAQIQEEHDFTQQLLDLEVSVVPPLPRRQNPTGISGLSLCTLPPPGRPRPQPG